MKKRLLVTILVLTLVFQLFALPVFAAASTEEIVDVALELLYYNEGSYGSINKDDNGAVSIGKIQWHANRALTLLKIIVEMGPESAQAILTPELYEEITTSSDWSKRIVSAEEADVLSALLTSDNGMAAQDTMATKDVTTYVNHGQNLGITDPAALVYFADMENQGGYGMSSRVAKAAAANVASFEDVTLAVLHEAALEDRVAGKYSTRRNRTYTYCAEAFPESSGISAEWSEHPEIPVSAGNTDATLSAAFSVKNAAITDVTEVSIAVYDSTGMVLGSRTDAPVVAGDTVRLVYRLSSDLNCTLAENTQYTYQFQTVIGGELHFSPTYTFVTGPDHGYTVIFDANGGSCDTTSRVVPNGAFFGTLPVPVREGFAFEGWYTEADGGTQIHSYTQAPLTGGITLYARWGHAHSYTPTVTAPSCTNGGYTTYRCPCGHSYEDDYIAAPGHAYENGICTVCGASAFSMGDANNDGSVNNVDAMLVLQYAVGLLDESKLNIAACNVNNDSSINNVDAMLVLQYAVGLIEVFPTV